MHTNNNLEFYAPDEPEEYEPPQERDYTQDEVEAIERQISDNWLDSQGL